VVDCRYLAKTKGQIISISSTYILFVTKLQKRQIPDKGFAHFEKTISQVLNQSQNLEYIAGIGNWAHLR
jgi:hypothetical protein